MEGFYLQTKKANRVTKVTLSALLIKRGLCVPQLMSSVISKRMVQTAHS